MTVPHLAEVFASTDGRIDFPAMGYTHLVVHDSSVLACCGTWHEPRIWRPVPRCGVADNWVLIRDPT